MNNLILQIVIFLIVIIIIFIMFILIFVYQEGGIVKVEGNVSLLVDCEI